MAKFSSSTLGRVVKYVLVKASTIFITIFIGIFITVVLANQGGQIDASVRQEIATSKNREFPGCMWMICQTTPEEQARMDQWQRDQEQAAGLNLPYWPRQLLWTIKALRLDWRATVDVYAAPGSWYPNQSVKDIILTDLPHTLLLIGSVFLLLFSIGIPLALYLSRKHGSRLDRLMTMLAAVTPIPSWVIGILLILVFAVELHILPPGGMYGTVPAETWLERVATVLEHMLLPVLAILLSLFTQCVYTWRAFFLLYADEDYVELARAKGLTDKVVERSYILKPTLPYIITSFAITLTGFWQMAIALEKIINWPGIGRLYINSLPDFLGEHFNPGIMPITLGIVVLFAYILGITVFTLDITYALVDPRVRIGDEGQTVRPVRTKKHLRVRVRREDSPASRNIEGRRTDLLPGRPRRLKGTPSARVKSLQRSLNAIKPIFREILNYPSAVFGLVVILLLVIGTMYAVTAFPYNQIGQFWYTKALSGKVYVPKLAQPAWVNWFRRDPLPDTIILDSQNGSASKTVRQNSDGSNIITITYTIKYLYGGFPQGLIIYFDPKYVVKQPFVILTWITPDGREFQVGKLAVTSSTYYDFLDNVYVRQLLSQNAFWRNWFVEDGNYPTPGIDLLFADPAASKPVALQGNYTLRVDGTTFEAGSDLNAELVLLGQVYGWAGTDYMRRDLLVPLVWGMPFALLYGLLGASITIILSLILAATGTWFGGWVDNLIQRLVEANMILPVIGIGVLIYSYFNASIWMLLGIVVLLNVFGSPVKSFRAAFMQIKDAPYIESARAYGAGNGRIIFHYLIPRILPILIPQLVILIPSYVFLEATLGIFNVKSDYPTWGKIIYEALRYGGNYGSSFWVLEPIGLLLLTGLAFAMLGFALERVLNPRMRAG